MSKKRMLGRFLTSTMLTGVAATAAAPAFAQDEAASDEGDRIVVTGSRIAREDLSAPSPIARIDSEQLQMTNTVNSEQFLNTLPQVIPAFDSTSNNPGNGTATVNLRGLGTKRTLVLVDGSRFVTSGPGAVVDINNIPTALVERVEVVTGGASAVYGSDAMAGVVNFILKDDFEGVQLDVSDELSAAGWDGNILNVALTMGGNFADGRGNAIMSMSYTNREALFQSDRDFSTFTLFDPGSGNTAGGFVTGGSGSVLGGQFTELAGGITGWDTDPVTPGQQVYPCAPAPGETCSNNITFNGAPDGRRFRNPTDQYNYAPSNYLQLPQERYSIFAGGSYEISDNIEAYARGIFASTTVDQQLAPTPVGGTFIINLDNPNLTAAASDAFLATYTFAPGAHNPSDLDGDGEADDVRVSMNRRFADDVIGNRNALSDTNTFQIKAGVRGDVLEDWNYDVFFQFGRSNNVAAQTGNISFSALQAGILDGSCNVFGVNTLSQDCANSIGKTGTIYTQVEQTQIVGTLGGPIHQFVMPGAEDPVQVSLGVEYREEYANFQPDSVLGPDVRGFNASLPVQGRFDVYEAFFETEIPIIQDVPFIEEFTINGAYRFSSYSTGAGNTHSFAVGGDWVPIEGLRIRSQFQRATRAPNVGELFAAFTNGFPGAQDPCSGGAFGSYVAANAGQCNAWGVPAGQEGTAFQLSGQIEALFGGNVNVSEEVADTLTIGAVWSPSMVDGLTLQVDFYDISLDGAIAAPPLQLLLDRCYVEGDNATCAQYFGPGTRDPITGAIGAPNFPSVPVGNFAALNARGIDVQASYGFDLADVGAGDLGSLSFNFYGSYTLQANFQNDPSAPIIECTGEYGVNCGEPTPAWKHTMQASWLWGPLTTSVRWRLLSGVEASPEEVVAFDLSDLSDDIPMFNYVDVTLGWAVSEHLDLSIGVQNITGKDAPLLGSTVNEQANTYPATYDTLGRTVFFGASLRF